MTPSAPATAPALSELLEGFPRERTWLLPALRAVQRARGWLSPEDLMGVGAHLRVPVSEVYGVATHYPELRLQPRGRHLVRVCTGVPCRARGALGRLRMLEAALGVRSGETTADGRVTLEAADCCFVCSVAPVVEVNHQLVADPTVEAVLAACADGASGGAAGAGAVGSGQLEEPIAPPPSLPPALGPVSRLDALVVHARALRPPRRRLLVGTGSCGLARGAGETLAALRAVVAREGLQLEVEAGACNGLCYAAPAVEVLAPDAPRLTLEGVTPERVPAVVALLRGRDDHGLRGVAWAETPVAGLPPVAAHPVLGRQDRRLTRRWGTLAGGSLADALVAGAYRTLAQALEAGDPGAVTARVREAGLLGRGGAYFPAAVKWEGCRRARGEPKYVVVNGEEGEPGIFKDRHLMEADPHGLLEGVLLAAWASGASRAILYVHGEAELSAARCARAVAEARAWGLLGPSVLGTAFGLEVELRRGLGGFVLGEETALLESLEGRRAMPRPKPPFPVDAGAFGRPTVVNNVETLAAVPLIVSGEAEAAHTKLFALSGHVARPGLVEVAPPVTLRRLIEALGGGLDTGRPLGAVVIGGPSGIVVSPSVLDTPLERPTLPPGTGGVTALDDSVPVLEVVRTLLAFNARESCGKCTPCREGTVRMLELLDRLAARVEASVSRAEGGTTGGLAAAAAPAGAASASTEAAGVAPAAADLARLLELCDVVQFASLCGLGQAAPLAVRSALEHFAAAFAARAGAPGGTSRP